MGSTTCAVTGPPEGRFHTPKFGGSIPPPATNLPLYFNVDIGIIKNTQVAENVRTQFWIDFFNVLNSRNFGIPSGVASSPGFLNQWATDGGNRRIRLGVRLVF